MRQIPQDGENGQNVAFFLVFVTKRFQFLSTVLKRLCLLDAKNVSVLVLANCFDLAIFGTVVHQSAMMVMMICRTIISQTSNNSNSGSR